MATFKKRVFGAEVEEDVILEFEKLGTGGQISETTTPDGEILKSVNPTYEDYLGDKTPQCRMWCAVAINEFIKYLGMVIMVKNISKFKDRHFIFHPNKIKPNLLYWVGMKTAKKLVFSVNQHNEENNYSNPLEQLKSD